LYYLHMNKGDEEDEGTLLKRFIYAFVGINGIVMILNEVL